ncbi:MAG: efflux RND transporter periplasmic adaptor subunit [Deltaproteobacteria bacterium]|nr:efflux RND transporter periplasmic adaptor subunit [Deltaproteobacteria bacterium]MBW1925034.1 efflux RND transporter periplasmic adaptor subunit [Deltaproteobacteria bacterium]MBW1949136.1 efflux RND transporter periplasmic adaptor subunit [Deltaproteobacteria bacterium]MBW2008651.1 efflux RND transporter periplasmic adaptor subunit [Deltaproteobacteria bacterium]
MDKSLYSPSWYRVASLRPRLRRHAEIHRHEYRGQLWYVLQDHSSGKFHRFTPGAYHLIGLMDGRRTVQEIWDMGTARLGDDAPTQEEMIALLGQLHGFDLLLCDVPPDTEELLQRYDKQYRARVKQNLRSPLAVRLPLLDPDLFLERYAGWVRPVFGWAGALLWVLVLGAGLFQAGAHWGELTRNVTDRILAPQNLFLLWVTFPFVKAFHEFGHAFAAKVWGGEVHEMGIMFLVFTPVPYVDASAASAFPERRRRLVVGAAGIMVELFIASLALFFWINAEPGTARSVAYNIMLIAGVSALLFNGNPLLRYDGYYILVDLLGIPNLWTRGTRYVGYLVQRYLLGVKGAEPPVSTPGERAWFLFYAVASYIYRLFIYSAIILFVAGKFLVAGVLIAAWAVASMFVVPAAKRISFLLTSPLVRRRRVRAILTSALLGALGAALVFVVPIPLWTRAEGVVWVPEKSLVRAGTDGFVERLLVEPGTRVHAGMRLIRCRDPLLPAHVRVLECRIRELEAVYDAQILADRVKAQMTREEMAAVRAELDLARERLSELTIVSPTDGVLVVPNAGDLPGKYLKKGQLVAYVVDPSSLTARVVVPQKDVDLVRHGTRRVEVRLAENLSRTIPAVVRREVPAAVDRLPSSALGREGGGKIAVDPRDGRGTLAMQKVFQFDLELRARLPELHLGSRAYVRFDHGREPLADQCYRALRRLFLKRFKV